MPKPTKPTDGVAIGTYGQPWKFRVVPRLKNSWGYCDYDKREVVMCRTAQKEGIDREILIHEVLHKIMPFLDEDCVVAAAVELDEALEACGY
jgi:hypothetical protein